MIGFFSINIFKVNIMHNFFDNILLTIFNRTNGYAYKTEIEKI